MGVAHQISRITEVFGRDPALLQWVLRDPVARTSGLLANLSEMQRELLYRYCVLGLHEGEIADWLAEAYPGHRFDAELDRVTVDIIACAPSLLDVYRARRKA
jgi:hypothetical protein